MQCRFFFVFAVALLSVRSLAVLAKGKDDKETEKLHMKVTSMSDDIKQIQATDGTRYLLTVYQISTTDVNCYTDKHTNVAMAGERNESAVDADISSIISGLLNDSDAVSKEVDTGKVTNLFLDCSNSPKDAVQTLANLTNTPAPPHHRVAMKKRAWWSSGWAIYPGTKWCGSGGSAKYDDLGPSGKCTGLVTDSLPTHWMPTKSIVTPKTSRPDPTEREPPSVPERVFYLNFGDLSKDVTAVAPPWVVKENSATVYMIGLPSDSGWRIFVSLTTETGLIAHVKVSGFPVPHLAQNLEKKRLKSFLADLLQMTDCTGVTEPTLQEFAGPPDDKSKFFRHHQYLSADNKVKHTSCVSVAVSMLANQTGSEEYRQQMTLTFSNSSHGERRESARASYPVHRGTYDLLDECCRTHDHCDTSISPWKYKYGKFNWYIWTISLCDCDDTFKQCMRNVTRGPQKGAAQTVDFIYFRLLGIKCFTLNDKGKAVMRS